MRSGPEPTATLGLLLDPETQDTPPGRPRPPVAPVVTNEMLSQPRTPTAKVKDQRRELHLGQADAESVAVEIGVLPSVAQLAGLSRDPAGRRRGRGVLLLAQVLVLKDVVSVLPLGVSGTRRHHGPVDHKAVLVSTPTACEPSRGGAPYPTMAAVGRVLCCGWAEALVESVTSLPAFSQSKGSFSVMMRSFMLLSNTDMSSCSERTEE